MHLRLYVIVSLTVVGLILGATKSAGQTVSEQEQKSTAAVKIKPLGEIRKLADGFRFTEGPAWDPRRRVIYFTDIPNTTIHALKLDGKIEEFTTHSARANGLLLTSDGRLLACQMDGQLVVYNIEKKTTQVLANQFEGKAFNAPNDLIIDRDGGIYFTDPLFGAADRLPQEIQAVYYRHSDGTVARVTGGIEAPNGIALAPDGKRLYVAPSRQRHMLVFEVLAPGKLSEPAVFCELKQPLNKQNTGGDGMAVDVEGNLYFTTHLGVQIFAPSGDPVGLVSFPMIPANVTFAGNERKTMVVTARTTVYAVEMPIAGLPPN